MSNNSGKTKLSAIFSILLAISLAFGLVALPGCDDDDDEGKIQVCNHDNHDYVVKLHRDSNGVVLREFEVKEWELYDSDECDEFEDVDEGRYYLTIHRDNESDATDTSGSFYVDNGDFEFFIIDSTGDIGRD